MWRGIPSEQHALHSGDSDRRGWNQDGKVARVTEPLGEESMKRGEVRDDKRKRESVCGAESRARLRSRAQSAFVEPIPEGACGAESRVRFRSRVHRSPESRSRHAGPAVYPLARLGDREESPVSQPEKGRLEEATLRWPAAPASVSTRDPSAARRDSFPFFRVFDRAPSCAGRTSRNPMENRGASEGSGACA